MSGAGQFTQQSSGILVPTATLDKTQRTLMEASFKRYERFMWFAGTENKMLVVFHCMACKARIRLRRHNRIVDEINAPQGKQDAPGGDITLVCDCTIWSVR